MVQGVYFEWRLELVYNSFPSVRSVQFLHHVQLFATPWTAARQASLSITNSRSLLKLMSIESVMPSNHLILCRPLLLLPSIFPSIKVFSNKSVLRIRWLKYWSFSFSISPSNGYSGLISSRMDWLDLLAYLTALLWAGTAVPYLSERSSASKADCLVSPFVFSLQHAFDWWLSDKEGPCDALDTS